MRFLHSRVASPAIAFFALLLLMPTFLVIRPTAVAADSVPNASAAAQLASSSADSISSYRDVGAANPNMPVAVSVVIPLRNLGNLSSLVESVSDPGSSDFRHFLTRGEADQEFLPTSSQYESVLNYLTGAGFKVELTALNSTIVVAGTVAQVKEYLGQGVDMYTNGTYSYYQTTGASSLSGAYSFGSNSSGLLMRPDFEKSTGAGSGSIPAQNVTFTEGAQGVKVLQTVYNSTGLLSKGENGKGYTIGLLDFYGNTLVTQDLSTYDSYFGYPAPPSFNIVPIGPYNPNLGTSLGWDGEVDLDVQISHSMAPGANIILYVGNGELSLSTAVAAVVQDGRANVVSQSFGIPEWEYYEAGPLPYLFNLVFSDDYYMLGSVMGMSFLTSSGDGGGSGFSAGPMGGTQYPASSPYVTTLGGLATYVSTSASGKLSFNETAWSNIGFIPYLVNEGGSGGGVSILEPTPWYQSSLPIPSSYPDGRMVPDLALDASGNPGAYIIYQGSPEAIGGTSEASPLFAGLLTLLMGVEKGPLGLVNPALYALAENSKTYTTAFTPITFGYTIPWTAKAGYNLATGWGAPNIGEIARLYGTAVSQSALKVSVQVTNPNKGVNFTDFTPGNKMGIVATVTTSTGAVTSGTVTASLQTLGGSTAPIALTYSATQRAWTGSMVMANESGVAYVNVKATSGTSTGEGFSSTFVGYLANFIQPLAPYPWTFLPGLETAISITDLFGNFPELPNGGFPSQATVSFESYSMTKNTYRVEGSALLNFSGDDDYYEGLLQASFPSGPMLIVTAGPTAGYLPFVSGIGLLGTHIYPQMVAEPGSIAPGQSLTIVASITAPENIYEQESFATGETLGATMAVGANVTASLVSPNGTTITTVTLPEEPCAQALRVCGAAVTDINGYLDIPSGTAPGLYTVILNSYYNDETTGFNYTGSYWGQVYVASGTTSASITVSPSTLFEGENATISASITYPNGNEVTQGVYTALVYPENAEYGYSTLMHDTYEADALVPLTYDAAAGAWTATVTMPDPANAGIISSVNGNAEYYGGPYDVFVSGISPDGVPSNSQLSAQQPFNVQPYVYTADTTLTSPLAQTTRLALSNVTIEAGSSPVTFSNDYFIGANNFTDSDVTIASSVINGTLILKEGETTLTGVSGGSIIATANRVVLQHSDVSSLVLGLGATASVDSASSVGSVSPALPVLTVSSPSQNGSYTGSINIQVGIKGTDVGSITLTLDGKELTTVTSPSSQVTYPLNTTALADGTHTLTVVAIQSDLLRTSTSVTFSTRNQLAALNASLVSASRTVGSLNQSLGVANGNIASLQKSVSSANRTITELSYLAVFTLALALIAVAALAYQGRGGRAAWKY